MKAAIIGAGYVGIGTAMVLCKHLDIVFCDTNPEVVDKINKGKSPIRDPKVEIYFREHRKSFEATCNLNEALDGAAYCIICVPTPLNEQKNGLDVSAVDVVLRTIDENNKTFKNVISPQILIRSTLNLDSAERFAAEYSTLEIAVMPEFLREKYIFEDSFNPSRVVVGAPEFNRHMLVFLEMYFSTLNNRPERMLVSAKEATAIKLLSNSYLAMRVAFFNQVDVLASFNDLDVSAIIHGMGLDPRIGDYYNVPSSGFGGKCLPKDLRAAITEMRKAGIEHDILETVDAFNEERKGNSK